MDEQLAEATHRRMLETAIQEQKVGNYQQSNACCLAVVATSIHYLDAQHVMAVNHHLAGEQAEAVNLMRAIIKQNPAEGKYWHTLGIVLESLGRHQQALELFDEACIRNPKETSLRIKFADALCQAKQYGLAMTQAMSVIQQVPQATAGYLAAVRIHYATHDYTRAIEILKLGLTQLPEHEDLLKELAQSYQANHLFLDAKAIYEKLMQQVPHDFFIVNNLAMVLLGLGETKRALQIFSQAKLLARNQEEICHIEINRAVIENIEGRQEAALALLEQVLAVCPNHITALVQYLRIAKAAPTDQRAQHLESLLAQNDLSIREQVSIYHVLAKAHEKSADTSRYFSLLRAGNHLLHANQPYDASADRALAATIKQQFPAHYIADVISYDLAGPQPIFIVGMPRSGTSLVEQILSCHPEVTAAGELYDLSYVVHSQMNQLGLRYPQDIQQLDRVALTTIAQHYLQRIARFEPQARYITDKMPGNFTFVGLILKIFPEAKIIHTLRDPMDNCFSCYKQFFEATMAFANDFSDLAAYYQIYSDLMAYWRDIAKARLLDVGYEDIVTDQRWATERLLQFCDVSWDERCLAFHEADRYVNTASSEQVRQPLYTDAVGAWRVYETELAPLKTALQAQGITL